jgi:hypothetical protein
MRKSFIPLILLLLPSSAVSGEGDAGSCVSSLSAEAKMIYEAVAPLVTNGSDLGSVVRRETIALVTAGRVDRASAPDSAKAAAGCLRQLS